jgi:NADPH-dependent 2,4-dienoyl-CoA reductase/sulfur reductase-like enzyme
MFDALQNPPFDALVIGAGPAGLTAASTLAERGLRVAVLDEQVAPGGQIYRSVTASPLPKRTILGDDYWRGETLVERFERSGASLISGATVWQIDRLKDKGIQVAASIRGQSTLLFTRQILLATGAQERPIPVPGWTRPGVMTVGAAQVLLKTTGAVPQGGTVLAGCGPLLWLYAAQVLRAGGRIDALLDTTPTSQKRQAMRHLFDFLRSDYVLKGVSLMTEVKRRVKVIGNVTSFAATGDLNGPVNAVEYIMHGSVGERIPVDTLLVHQGVVPNVNLSKALGCRHEWNDLQCCWQPVVDMWFQSSHDDVYIAGDGSGIGGARAAESQGELAALQMASKMGACSAEQRDQAARPIRLALQRALRGRLFFETMYRPSDALRIPAGDTIVCRCEEVTAQQVVDAAKVGCSGPNQLKAFLRCGMGPCQGRFCGLSVAELLARENGTTMEAVGYYTLRFPTKPLTLAELAGLPPTESGEAAVVTA